MDDNDTNLDITERALRLEGVRATPTRNGQQAIQALRAPGAAFDAVLMDMQMPVMDGLTATRTIRGQLGLAELPIIVFPASVLPQERDEAMAAGATAFLGKPVDIEQLVAVLLPHRRSQATTAVVLQAPAAAAQAAAELPPWPPIEGIDDSRMRLALRGNFALFMRLCAEFMEEAKAAPDHVAAALEQDDSEAAVRTLHGLRGAALSLGANALAKAAGPLEEAVRTGRPVHDTLQAYEASLAQLGQALAPWVACAAQEGGNEQY